MGKLTEAQYALCEKLAERFVDSEICFGGLEYSLSGKTHEECVRSFKAGFAAGIESEQATQSKGGYVDWAKVVAGLRRSLGLELVRSEKLVEALKDADEFILKCLTWFTRYNDMGFAGEAKRINEITTDALKEFEDAE